MKKEKVVVGLSGGVDSSVAALLLIEQGYEVEGLFMRNWDSMANNDFLGNNSLSDLSICPQEQDYEDAKKVAKSLGIKLHRVDFVKEYWDDVFQNFLTEYQEGRTPNPDILCNKYIKFNRFLTYATVNLQAKKIAMGHYAGVRFNTKTHQYELFKPLDDEKDQTYFLSQLNQQQLSKALFPLVDLKKIAVRAIAEKHHLATAKKPDSTGICFIGERKFTQFLQNYIPNQPGKIVDIVTNQVIGEHIGTMYYTIGQRKGLKLGGMTEPYYVVRKDPNQCIIYAAKLSDESFLTSDWVVVQNLNWIVNLAKYLKNTEEFVCTVKFRYRQPVTQATVVKLASNHYKVYYETPLRAVTEGQQAVFYLNDLCLGGGTIVEVGKNKK